MSSRKLFVLFLALMFATAVAIGGCAPPEEAKEEDPEAEEEEEAPAEVDNPAVERPNEIVIGGPDLEGIFNPVLYSGVYDSWVLGMIFDSLLTVDENGQLTTDQRSVAKDYEISEDGTVYTFHLREGWEFHDGEEITAEDVAFSLEVTAHPDYDGPRSSFSDDIVGVDEFREGETDELEGITVEDDYTLVVEAQEPSADNIFDFAVMIMPKHYYDFENYEDFQDLTDDPMGSGPFELVEYSPDQHAILESFEDYYHGAPNVDRIIYEETETEQQIPMVETGEADIVQVSSTPENMEMLEDIDHQEALTFFDNAYTYIGLNHEDEHLQHQEVRQALAYALDIEAFLDGMFGDELAQPIYTPFSPVSWAYPDEDDMNDYAYDPDKANELLDEAGYEWDDNEEYRVNEDGERLSFTWETIADNEWSEHLTTLALEQWPQIGVELEIENYDFNTLTDRIDQDRGDVDMWNMGWSLSAEPDPSNIFSVEYADAGLNYGMYHNEEAEELMQEGLETFDQDERAEVYNELGVLFNEDLPYIFVYSNKEIWSTNDRVENYEPTAFQHLTWNIHEWEVTDYEE
ncbi:ABC transporter substrate-binding protein [Natranaerobius thermophilus]|uniref:Extracellular solute-binding protein family 5 n=1 Tax=Natranaerobius thermophilus (strain ATCC BAA-1301 / DSM 18059 / JW/NM-WN-LF) TaxID=457570 RepID=B2A5Y0_NATTJ|nr:ABC transporter substrate-binding protein [Natranaerobius thermophilus]ACB84073.1 extracellular solute-binding protein family 5 [Natranaerobius thermophilus JW/NM-WN-LF]